MSIHRQRTEEIDFLKFVFIILMIAFHLVFIGDTYPYAKQFVYTFHMPAFLVISGFMLNTEKPIGQTLHTMLWIFIPYAVLEWGYTIAASMLPVREHVSELTAKLIIENIFIHPLGPYWYLHTLMLCGLTYALTFHFVKFNRLTMFVLLGILYTVYAQYLHIVSLPCAFYFMAGAIVRQSGVGFLSIFRPSFLTIIPIVWLSFYPENLDRAAVTGVMLVYLIMCFCLSCYPFVRGFLRKTTLFIGRNTLVLLMFSPLFTVLAKLYQPFLVGIDPSGMVFLAASLLFAVGGCFALAYVMDRLRISRFFFGKPRILQ